MFDEEVIERQLGLAAQVSTALVRVSGPLRLGLDAAAIGASVNRMQDCGTSPTIGCPGMFVNRRGVGITILPLCGDT